MNTKEYKRYCIKKVTVLLIYKNLNNQNSIKLKELNKLVDIKIFNSSSKKRSNNQIKKTEKLLNEIVEDKYWGLKFTGKYGKRYIKFD